jgi:hypothetical protein
MDTHCILKFGCWAQLGGTPVSALSEIYLQVTPAIHRIQKDRLSGTNGEIE